jgi:hypothetical protein
MWFESWVGGKNYRLWWIEFVESPQLTPLRSAHGPVMRVGNSLARVWGVGYSALACSCPTSYHQFSTGITR